MRRETRLAGEAMEQKFARQTETMEITLKQKDEEVPELVVYLLSDGWTRQAG
jgi:hypothetical protein